VSTDTEGDRHAIYPSTSQIMTGKDGVDRKMSDDKYLNRLVQALSDSIGKHGPADVITGTLKSLGERLSALDSLASKGVHATVTRAEVDICVVQTYLMVGDVLRITTPDARTIK
jgi:hypothetical protein